VGSRYAKVSREHESINTRCRVRLKEVTRETSDRRRANPSPPELPSQPVADFDRAPLNVVVQDQPDVLFRRAESQAGAIPQRSRVYIGVSHQRVFVAILPGSEHTTTAVKMQGHAVTRASRGANYLPA
jgi:hypothetical protein